MSAPLSRRQETGNAPCNRERPKGRSEALERNRAGDRVLQRRGLSRRVRLRHRRATGGREREGDVERRRDENRRSANEMSRRELTVAVHYGVVGLCAAD